MADATVITLTVRTQQGMCTQADPEKYSKFRIKLTTPMAKLMTMYCNRFSIDAKRCIWIFEEAQIFSDETCLDLELDDGHHVTCVVDP